MANGIQGLLGDPLFNIGVGLLASGGPQTQPVSIGQGLASSLQFAQQRRAQSLLNQARLGQVQDAQNRRQAIQQLQGLLGGEQTPESQQQLMGLLARVAPEQVAQGLLAQPQQARTDILQRADGSKALIDKDTGQVIRELSPPGAGQEEIQTRLNLLEAEQRQAELKRERREQRTEIETARNTVRSRIDNIERLIELNNRLAQTGQADQVINALGEDATTFTRIAKGLFGKDASAQRAAQEFRQRVNRLVLDESAQRNLNTNFGLRLTQDIKPNLTTDPIVNSRLLGELLQESLNAANVAGVEFRGRRPERLRRLVDETRQPRAARAIPAPESQPSVIEFSDLPEQ